MLVRDIMRSPVVSVPPETTLEDAYRTMREKAFRHLPVLDGERLVGVVTDRDLALRILAEDKSADTPVGEIASKDVVTVDPQQSLEEAARLMAEHQVRRLPVTEEDGKLVGILAQADVAQAGHDSLTGDVVQQISKS
jgi:acetoin utilization protein AcuB